MDFQFAKTEKLSERTREGFLLVLIVLVLRTTLVYLGKSASLFALRHSELHGLGVFLYNPYYLAGMITLFIVSIVWILALRRLQLTRAYAILALQYISALAVAGLCFDEKIGPFNLLGGLVIVVGVILVNSES